MAYDFGIKQNILRMLVREGCRVTVVPAETSAEDVFDLKPDGVFLSNGPGDPGAGRLRRARHSQIPGPRAGLRNLSGPSAHRHWLWAASTYKLKFGHHGGNHPVRNNLTGKVEITAHNHNFAVDPDSINANEVELTHVDLNDQTLEGLRHRTLPLVQRAVPPRSRARPARLELPLPRLPAHDGGVEIMSGLAARMEEPRPETIIIPELDLHSFLREPQLLDSLEQTEIPRLARNPEAMKLLEQVLLRIPTSHFLVHGDAREMQSLAPESVHLVLTSPPYWTLKKYEEADGQLGHVIGYDEFLAELGRVWRRCFDLLVPGGRLICVVGDVCLSRKQNDGRHTVVPLHASIQELCRKIGFDNLAPDHLAQDCQRSV